MDNKFLNLAEKIDHAQQQFFARPNGYLLNFAYAFLILWLFTWWACHHYFIILFLPVFIIYYFSYALFFLFSIVLLIKSKRLVSESTIVAIVLFLPLILFLYGHDLYTAAKLRLVPPNETTVRALISQETGSNYYDYFNTATIYDRKDKQLIIHVIFLSERYIDWFFNRDFNLHEELEPEIFVNQLRNYYVFPEVMSEVSKVPKEIILYGYWNKTPIVENHFTLIKGSYRMTESTPLRLLIEDGSWVLEYTMNNITNRLDIIQVNKKFSYQENFW